MEDIDKYRPGNLVVFNNELTMARIVKVTQIEYMDNKISSLQINSCNWVSNKEIKPAQLFVDCLLNLKFHINRTYINDKSGNITKVDYQEDIYRYYNGSLELLIHKSDNTIWYKKKQIHYIHQLQNLCSDITGEPYTIADIYDSYFTRFYFEYLNI